jgi:hypothetical protein
MIKSYPSFMPDKIQSFNDPDLIPWKKYIKCLDSLNQDTNAIMISMHSYNSKKIFPNNIKKCLYTLFAESPAQSVDLLNELAQTNPHVDFIVLADHWFYDFPLAENITTLEYRQNIIYLDYFVKTFDKSKFVFADQKEITKKFSSLSFKKRQHRALATAALLTYAKEESIISWHNYDKEDQYADVHDYLIKSFVDYDKFKHLDWNFVDKQILIDDYNMNRNIGLDNILDIAHCAYTDAFVNLINETDGMGYHNDGKTEYNRPGPYTTEKIWKALLAGNAIISIGQPNTIKFFKECYHLPLDYDFDNNYDSIDKDFDRFERILELIKNLSDRNLKDIVEKNIDVCKSIQKTIINPDYVQMILDFNAKQDEIILNLLNQNI